MTTQTESIKAKPNLGKNIQHASCSNVAPKGTYPTKSLCGVEILYPSSPGSLKCIVCEGLFGVWPCGACGRDKFEHPFS